MKKTSHTKKNPEILKPDLKWQTGRFSRYPRFHFILPYPFLLLCRLMDTTPEEIVYDFTVNLSCGSWKREERENAKGHLIDYFIAHGYGRHHYSEEDIRQIFREMDAVGLLFPKDGKRKPVERFAKWRNQYQVDWFKQWFRKPRRKIAQKNIA